MQAKLTDGSVMVCGPNGRDAEFSTVGANNSRKCTASLAVGKRPGEDGKQKTVWCNVVAWHDLASLLAPARKGDADYYNAVDVGDKVCDDFRVGSFALYRSVGSWDITVADKRTA